MLSSLNNALLCGTELVCSNLKNANLSNAQLIFVDLRGADLSNANLRGSYLSDIKTDERTNLPGL
ncbi:MAG: pentapeptide repeat-containing protein [Xenococcaceae cyanobacterium]